MLRFRNLGSGSSGNCTVIEAGSGSNPVRLLVDCGLGIRQLKGRLQSAGLDFSDLTAIFITHEHSDHLGCVHSLSTRYRVPVWMSHGTYLGAQCPDFDGLLHLASDSQAIDLGALEVLPFTVPHDAREPLQLTCTDGASRLGLLTDLGHASSHVIRHLQGCHALMMESNHDPVLLSQSSYPPFLKKRVGGPLGHLSNEASAELLAQVNHAELRQVVAAHLSAQNNRPELARAALGAVWNNSEQGIIVAGPRDGTPWITV